MDPPPIEDTPLPKVKLLPATHTSFPAEVDSNSPSFWEENIFHLFNSASDNLMRSTGPDPNSLTAPENGTFPSPYSFGELRTNRWIEAVWETCEGTLWAWYHAEPWDSVCPNTSILGRTLTAPYIGAAKSFDRGFTWIDLGMILSADPKTLRCDTQNGYFSGGVGDPSVMLDPQGEYLYIFFGTYSGDVSNQGVSIARMEWDQRFGPVGKVWRWYNGDWNQPGISGISTPTFKPSVDWNLKDADAFWGPAVHWNTYLRRYVMLLNRTKNANYEEEGIYISYSTDLSDPARWTVPQKIYDGGDWYPQVVGYSTDRFKGTDRLAGRAARFYIHGNSDYEIVFSDSNPRPLHLNKASQIHQRRERPQAQTSAGSCDAIYR